MGRVQCACAVGVCGVGEEPHAEGVFGGGALDRARAGRTSNIGCRGVWSEIDERVLCLVSRRPPAPCGCRSAEREEHRCGGRNLRTGPQWAGEREG